MKKSIFIIAGALLTMTGLHSCMDFDMPSDEFVGGAVEVESTVFHGNPDSLFFEEPTAEGLQLALDSLNKGAFFGQLQTAQYNLRGGKDGGKPAAHAYQYVYNATIDNYAGYFVIPHRDFLFAGALTSTYSYHREFCDGPHGVLLGVKNSVINMVNHPMIDSIPEIKAWGLLLYNMAAQEQIDLYGTIAYTDHKNNKESNPFYFEPMSEVYDKIVANLDDIVTVFNAFETKSDDYKAKVTPILKANDRASQGKSFQDWARLANSLKLRMAIHIAQVDPAKAQKWAQEAINSGVVETTGQELKFDMLDGTLNDHPLIMIAGTWGDSRLNASFESILKAFNHPYLEYAFAKNSAPITNSVNPDEVCQADSLVIGLRAGIRMGDGQQLAQNPRQAYSTIKQGQEWSLAPLYVMKLSEVQFLRAEAALRWGIGGDAEFYYEEGIKNAAMDNRNAYPLDLYNNAMTEYLELEAPYPHDYIDPMDARNNHTGLIKVGVKWGGTDKEKLEKIITQKYIAAFPNSYEPFTDLRRTGYPKIYPVLNAEDADGSLVQGDLVRRLLLPGSDTSIGLNDILTSGVQALGNDDVMGLHVWWDLEENDAFSDKYVKH